MAQIKAQSPIPGRRGIQMTALIQTQTEEFTANRSALSIPPPGATLVVPPNPVFVNIKPSHLEALQALGYTESEARFLYIVATHSGSFVARQFLAFTCGHWGKRTTALWSKLPAKIYYRQKTSQPTLRYFFDKNPTSSTSNASSPLHVAPPTYPMAAASTL